MAGATTMRFGKATIRLEGFTDLSRQLNKVGGNAQEAAKEVFASATRRVYAKSQALVPVDEGNLKASGRISKPRVNRKTQVVTASVNYGGTPLRRLAPDEPAFYAVAVHEDSSHPGFKFLERPMVAEKAAVMRDLSNRIAARIGMG